MTLESPPSQHRKRTRLRGKGNNDPKSQLQGQHGDVNWPPGPWSPKAAGQEVMHPQSRSGLSTEPSKFMQYPRSRGLSQERKTLEILRGTTAPDTPSSGIRVSSSDEHSNRLRKPPRSKSARARLRASLPLHPKDQSVTRPQGKSRHRTKRAGWCRQPHSVRFLLCCRNSQGNTGLCRVSLPVCPRGSQDGRSLQVREQGPIPRAGQVAS